MTDARTEPSLRAWLVEQQEQAEEARDSCYDIDYSDIREFQDGRATALQEAINEIDRRDAVPTVTTLDGLLQHLDQNEDYFAMDINKRYHDDGTECVITLARPTQRKISHTGKSFAESIAAVESATKGEV